MSMHAEDYRPVACVYSSKTGTWGNLITSTDQCNIYSEDNHGILIGGCLYWYVRSNLRVPGLASLTKDRVEFDLDRQTLAMINGPPDLHYSHSPRTRSSE